MTRYRKMILSRDLRRQSTSSEMIAWDMLRGRGFNGFKFRRQHVVRGFLLDFYCFELKLAVEIDGSVHGNQVEYDAMRQEIIEREGLSFVRITVNELEESPETLFERIREFISSKQEVGTFPSPAGWERG